MKKFEYVEDYLEIIAGARDIVSGNLTAPVFLYSFEPIINLARYDNKVLDSMAAQALQSQPLTERQGELACKIILNYRRQLAAKLLDVSPIETPKWRTALRKMDYSKRLYIDNDTIILRFPYHTEMITGVKEFVSGSQGLVKWNKEQRYWEVALTEYNLSWAYAWAQVWKFDIDPAIETLFNKIQEVEKTPYAIELQFTGQDLIIANAAPSLLEYVNTHLGGLGIDNLLTLVDQSALLGYTVDHDIQTAVFTEYGARFFNLAANREIKINPDSMNTGDDFESVIDYAVKCKRFPIVVYEPDLSNRMLSKLKTLFAPEEILVQGNKQVVAPSETTRVIYTHKPLKNMQTIPLLISSAGMVFGGDKQVMLQRTEKVVFCAADVYNTKNTKKVKSIAG